MAQLAVGGTTPYSMASAQAAISIEPIAPSECPTIDLIELIGTRYAAEPSARLNAAVSCRSFCRVPEPCALTYDTADGASRACRSASVMATAISAPSGRSPVMWKPLLRLA